MPTRSQLATRQDPFAAIVGTRRGADHPPSSKASPIRSLADLRRRVRNGVVAVVDQLDATDRVVRRMQGSVERHVDAAAAGWSRDGFVLATAEGRLPLQLPRRARFCKFEGPSVTWSRWRLTLVEESQAEPLIDETRRPARPKLPPLAPDAYLDIDLHLYARAGLGYTPRWRYWRNGRGPVFGWMTEKGADGGWLSFVAEPAGPGSRSGRAATFRVDAAGTCHHAERQDARARSRRLLDEWLQDGGRPWR